MLYFNLQKVFKARHIDRPYSFLVNLGISPQTASKIANSDMQVLRLNHIELICKALYCEPNDLLAYKEDKKKPLPENHPLLNLSAVNDDSNWEEELKTLPIATLKQISKLLKNEEK